MLLQQIKLQLELQKLKRLNKMANYSDITAVSVDNVTIEKGATGALQLKDGGISTDKYADNSITDAKILQKLAVSSFQSSTLSQSGFSDASKCKDNNTSNYCWNTSGVGYLEFDLGGTFQIDQFRHFGHTSNNDDGEFKMQYSTDGTNWTDWITGISTRTSSWSSYLGTSIIATHLKLVMVTGDSYAGGTIIGEVEASHSAA